MTTELRDGSNRGASARTSSGRRAAVLCPGPSLPGFQDRSGYDFRIGVNRAAGAFQCDYWVALDVHTAGITEPIGKPVIVNKPNIYRRMRRDFPYVKRLSHLPHTGFKLGGDKPLKVPWGRFGATVALVLASHLGACEVDCFGVDWSGQDDFDGFTCSKNRRSENRWQRERQIWQRVCQALAAQGVAVRHLGKQSPVETGAP